MAPVKTTRVTRASGRSSTKVKSGAIPKASRARTRTTTWMAKRTIDTPTTDRASSSRGKATFFTMPALPTTTVVAAMARRVEQVPDEQAGEQPDGEVGLCVLRDDLEDHVVDGQHQSRVEHRPEVTEHGVLVLDLELGPGEEEQQVAIGPEVLQPLAQLDLAVDHRDLVVALPRDEAGAAPDGRNALRLRGTEAPRR